MDFLNNTTAIITAAGSGKRLPGNRKKQFRELEGIPILIRSMEPFMASELIDNLVITVPESDIAHTEALIEQWFEGINKPYIVIAGGLERQDSVFSALQVCPEGTEYVAIHDGVRPFVSQELLEILFSAVVIDKAVIPAGKIKHTVMQVEGNYAVNTLPRHQLINVFTPQVFAYSIIMEAYHQAYKDSYFSTDDASLVQHLGMKIRYIWDNDFNIKVTDEADLFFAKQLIEKKKL
ncbi:2-C-methyl-D-erythritol 4-phosphate cytidylyltransferase [Candidatus Cloacimonas acidaminovorans]|uniref:2-C-methyl-D-erythritol 4-phosphate cytidylyltransferase (4-diphosphocytidyl-2C-methyl-D-erythritol synthase) (MEP cytidylyltransferase) (MCT) n=1 Tax=Cloacimonas acidaminovorans (strain Evry) TaxID=459349 RepID=B0VFK3_CLOAI|nr:2-C-methyl-D-erythritol 4-phosphate cytidylyltransferase [Candidatus Cloacimonas acidaminovorans]MDD3605902.1 2-C-methyl-D-erythritol 4-phosphate cytidylyltransferase [Candidatus Cloacimonas acidaminovorans]CAO81341.1 2-C-methyl-D-erythritol 4-phosphate cytidylyltransferase (4-diphosphocytidyl-2C-methyl-D-erythritol synthase) (MEP cytidylyltransferase) (MCT) [Candidatus Cloacimonas acidaminovorans str. Evry]